MDWKDVTLDKYVKIRKVAEETDLLDEEKNIEIVGILFDVETDNLSVVDYNRLLTEMVFMEKEIPKERVKRHYEIDGVKYVLIKDVGDISVSQYQDIVTYQKNNDIKGMISCILIPDGKKYGDDYETDYVGKVNMVDATSMLFFYINVWRHFTSLLEGYLERLQKKMEKNKKLTLEEKNQISESFHSLFDIARKQMKQ